MQPTDSTLFDLSKYFSIWYKSNVVPRVPTVETAPLRRFPAPTIRL